MGGWGDLVWALVKHIDFILICARRWLGFRPAKADRFCPLGSDSMC